ncbi:amino acid adenylation domain-containing protein [Rhizobium sp. BK591]|uniref:non-ribosomal peptide synthetase n=1 Tax=Rhizobium TaxID=379 RepID=UPI0007B528B5|nr:MULTISPECIES: non-ribosomal peptide synthetase [Rhizobium]KZS55141.1 non-ribosomal peptide synthetase [Rhizobium anhuiense bv. trifolii]MBB3301749.1 amino acid adenylation domain-containing protein [Rhizobium sp. BK112]MBB3370781.1 amino acid adenylation domain-containing protein [Rhizobium sp. BK077]MBB3746742.1 amino acid adenylation domain-containing protein [Rhizobium sp. BK591]MBB4181549.1 amino acid adenylation domain-containing protein [Rhizobium sp. BK109]
MNKQITNFADAHPTDAATDAVFESFPLTIAQKRIWSLEQIGNYTVFPDQLIGLRLSPAVDVKTIAGACRALAAQHPSLAIRFRRLAGGRVEQYRGTPNAVPIEIVGEGAVLDEPDALAAQKAFRDRRFDLLAGPPARVQIALLAGGQSLLTIVLHPIIADDREKSVLAGSLTRILDGRPAGETQPAEILAGTREAEWLQTEEAQQSLSYWRDTIGLDYAASTFPTRFNSGGLAGVARAQHEFSIEPDLWEKLEQHAQQKGYPVERVLHAAFCALLARYSGNYALLTGLLIARPQMEHLADRGRAEQVLPLILSLTSRNSLDDVIAAISSATEEGLRRLVPLERITQELVVDEAAAQEAVVKALFEFREPYPIPAHATNLEPLGARADSELSLVIEADLNGAASGLIDYAQDLYDSSLIARVSRHFGLVLEQIVARDNVRIKDIELVGSGELDWLSAPYEDDVINDDRPVYELIAAHSRQTPDKTAIVYGDEEWSHGWLEANTNRLAHRLRHLGVRAEVTVAIFIKRSPEAIVGILATLKAGGAYIPVEPDHPPVRNHHILRDGGVKIVLTHSWLRHRLPEELDTIILELDKIDLDGEPDTPLDVPIHKDQLAYVMYTSGSTGLPKGVAVEHGPLTHHLQNTSRVYGMSSASRELPFLPFSSDGGHERWMNPLMEGGSIILPDQPLWTPEETLTAMRKHGANNASIPTTYLQQLAEWADITDGAPPMRLYSFGGEGLAQPTFDLLSRALKSEWLINGYGPTETIMTPMVWKVRAGTKFQGVYAPLGRAVGLRRVYVLDPDLNPCPIGVTGELYIGGEGVARGYLGKPDTTADRFIPDPFSSEGGRLYRSGDLTRWRDDGTVEFVGRVDHQVKLRGYRIELGEIEAALLQQPGVGEALVVLRDDDAGGEKALVAYVVPKKDETLDVEMVRAGLERSLPSYMVPAAVVELEKMPTNPNSKLDRFALPAPQPIKRAIVEPASALEEEVLDVWRQVLKLEAISVEDNFFAIGGNSLGAIRILSLLRQRRPKTPLIVADIFNNPTIRSFAGVMEQGDQRDLSEVIVLRASGAKPRLYCFPGLLVSTREYVKLVDYLGADQPATGFICHSLSEKKEVGAPIEEIIESYVDYIRTHNKGAPCYFLGWSWGGLLAYEAARTLGNEVDVRMMAMVDVCDLGSEFAIGAKPRFRPGERDALHKDVQAWLGRTAMRPEWDRLLSTMDADTYDQFLRFVGDEKDPLPNDGPDISSREHTFWVLIDNALIFRKHRLVPHDVPIYPWAADDSLNRGLNLIDWRRLSPRARAAEIITGTNHLHMIGSPAFHSRLALRLKETEKDIA